MCVVVRCPRAFCPGSPSSGEQWRSRALTDFPLQNTRLGVRVFSLVEYDKILLMDADLLEPRQSQAMLVKIKHTAVHCAPSLWRFAASATSSSTWKLLLRWVVGRWSGYAHGERINGIWDNRLCRVCIVLLPPLRRFVTLRGSFFFGGARPGQWGWGQSLLACNFRWWFPSFC